MYTTPRSLLDFGIVFLSDSEYWDDVKRDEHLARLEDHLQALEDFQVSCGLWRDELIALLFRETGSTLWSDTSRRSVLVRRLMHLNSDQVDTELRSATHEPSLSCDCVIRPAMLKPYSNSDRINGAFLGAAHAALLESNGYFLCLSHANARGTEQRPYTISSACVADSLTPICIRTSREWLDHVEFVDNLWPTHYDQDQLARFERALDLTVRRQFPGEAASKRCYVSSRFVRDLSQQFELRELILKCIAARIVLSDIEMRALAQLKATPYKSVASLWHITIPNSACRIYYFDEGDAIKFSQVVLGAAHDRKPLKSAGITSLLHVSAGA